MALLLSSLSPAHRLALGTLPLVLAWPTLYIANPAVALIAQWGAFLTSWLSDRYATGQGWTPDWYAQYRFYLTALVGGSVIFSRSFSLSSFLHSRVLHLPTCPAFFLYFLEVATTEYYSVPDAKMTKEHSSSTCEPASHPRVSSPLLSFLTATPLRSRPQRGSQEAHPEANRRAARKLCCRQEWRVVRTDQQEGVTRGEEAEGGGREEDGEFSRLVALRELELTSVRSFVGSRRRRRLRRRRRRRRK